MEGYEGIKDKLGEIKGFLDGVGDKLDVGELVNKIADLVKIIGQIDDVIEKGIQTAKELDKTLEKAKELLKTVENTKQKGNELKEMIEHLNMWEGEK